MRQFALLVFAACAPLLWAFPASAQSNQPPASAARATLSSSAPAQGDVLIVRVNAPTASGLSGALVGGDARLPLNFAPDTRAGKGNFISLVGIDAMLPVGAYSLTVYAKPSDDAIAVGAPLLTRQVRVVSGRYVTEAVKIPTALSYTLDPLLSRDEKDVFDKIYAGFSPEKLWGGAFKLPTVGRTVAGYGGRRVYNGINLHTYHSGLDLSTKSGTPVYAAAAGEVVLADKFDIRGNAIVLDHGRGVFTAYEHLSKFEVQPGQTVKAGQLIGRVGTTGRSQGNHLHFEMAVGGAPVEPSYWLKVALP